MTTRIELDDIRHRATINGVVITYELLEAFTKRSLIIYQRGAVQHTAVFPLGGSHFTNDIAFGLRTPIPEAEKIKRTVGCACSSSLSEMERGRNEMGNDMLFVAQENKLYDTLGETFYAMKEGIEVHSSTYPTNLS